MTSMSAPRTVGIALIGAGMIAPSHVKALSALQDQLELKAVVSRSPQKARLLGALYHGAPPEFVTDLSVIAADPTIEIAIVATPPNVRKKMIEELADSGTHILLEKPVARTLEEAHEVVEICERAGVTLGVVFQHRTRASSIAAARHVASGALGDLGVVEIEVPLWREQSYYNELGRGTYARDGGGVMMTNAIHSLDLALSLAGPVTRVQAMRATSRLHEMEAEDFVMAGLNFSCGAVGSFFASTAVFPHRTEVIRLHFEKGSLRLDKDALEVSWRDGRTDVEAHADKSANWGKHEWHQAIIEDFLEAVRMNRKPLVSGREALLSHQLIDAIETSSKSGQAVDVPA